MPPVLPAFEVSYEGRVVRFRRPFSTFMPPLAVAVVDYFRARNVVSAYVADLAKHLGEYPDGPFEPLSTPYNRHSRLTRLLFDVVEVDGMLLTIEGDASEQRRRYEKVKRVVMREGVLPPLPPRPAYATAGQTARMTDHARPIESWPIDSVAPPPSDGALARTHDLVRVNDAVMDAVNRRLDEVFGDFNKRLAVLELAMMDGAAPLPADAAADLARVETEFKKRTFDLGVAQNRILARLERLDPQPPVVDQ